MRRILYLILGFVSFGIGVLGVFLPVLPTTSFMLVSAWAFAKSSPRFLKWLRSTKVYQNYGAEFEDGKGIQRKKKFRIITITWAIMLLSMYFVDILWVRLFITGSGLFFTWYLFVKLPDRPEGLEAEVIVDDEEAVV